MSRPAPSPSPRSVARQRIDDVRDKHAAVARRMQEEQRAAAEFVDSGAETEPDEEQQAAKRRSLALQAAVRRREEAKHRQAELERKHRRAQLPVAAAAAAAADAEQAEREALWRQRNKKRATVTSNTEEEEKQQSRRAMEDEPAADTEVQRDLDDMHLREHSNGLFPRGIDDIRPNRLFLGARIQITRRGMERKTTHMTQKLWDQFTIVVLLGDEGFRHTIEAGFMVLTFRGPRDGLHLDRFYGARALHVHDRLTWDCIERQSDLVLHKYMVSVLRAFIESHLLRHLFLSVNAPFALEAVSARAFNDSQIRLVNYYRTLGFLPTDAQDELVDETPMATTIDTFMEYTQVLARWTVDMQQFQHRYIRLPPDPTLWTHIYPVTQIGAPHAHV